MKASDVLETIDVLKQHVQASLSNGHYANAIQPIEYAAAHGWLEGAAFEHVLKYISRYSVRRNGSDLLKAAHFLLIVYAANHNHGTLPKAEKGLKMAEQLYVSERDGEFYAGPLRMGLIRPIGRGKTREEALAKAKEKMKKGGKNRRV